MTFANAEPPVSVTEAPAADVTLLSSKLTPPRLSPATVSRERLLRLLSHGVAATPVTLISGPAGSGKTVLAASWLLARSHREAIAWLSLDEADDDPATFWTYVTEALAGAGVDVAGVARPAAGEPVATAFTRVIAARVLAAGQPVVLILDNSDVLTREEICRELDLLVRHAGIRLRLVLCARADPQLPLHQYRIADLLTQIRRNALAFTADETGELLARLGVQVSGDVAADIQARTEGWAVGLRLAAAPLKAGMAPEQLVTSLAETDGSIAQYLFAEVLSQQPAPVRRFLLRTSVTPELWPDLVDRLNPRVNGRRILAALAHINAFVEQSVDAPGGYRIHPLFQEMLKAQLAYDHPGELASLHETCAAWYVGAGRLHAAIGHAISAGNWSLAAGLIVDDLLVAPILARQGDPCLRFLDAMPPDVPGMEAAVIRLATALPRCNRVSATDLRLCRAAVADQSNRLFLRVCAAVTAASVEARDGDSGTRLAADFDAAERLITELPEDRHRARRELTAALQASRAFALLRTDVSDEELVSALQSALAACGSAHSSRLRRRMLGELALVEALRGELRHGRELAAESAAIAGDGALHAGLRFPAAATAEAWISMERSDHADSRHWIARAQDSASDPERPWVAPLLAVLQSRLLRVRREFDAAEQLLRPHVDDRSLPRWVRVHVVGEQVRICLGAGQIETAIQVVKEAGEQPPWTSVLLGTAAVLSGRKPDLPDDDADLPPAVAVEVEILRVGAALHAGEEQASTRRLQKALRLAEPDRLRRPFVDSPPEVRRLLRSQPWLPRAAAWLNPSTDSTPDRPRRLDANPEPAAPEVIQALSERELEVLKHLAEPLSTAEIAASMFVSVNTVRTHIRNILRKLAVSRRNQAVRRGRDLRLI